MRSLGAAVTYLSHNACLHSKEQMSQQGFSLMLCATGLLASIQLGKEWRRVEALPNPLAAKMNLKILWVLLRIEVVAEFRTIC